MPRVGEYRVQQAMAAASGLVATVLSCTPGDSPPHRESPPELSVAVLRSAAYSSQHVDEGEIRLEGGSFEDTARRLIVSFRPEYAVGDVDADGAPDAAVLLATSTGGSGTFHDLAVVLNREGQPLNTATAFLGDRVLVERVRILEGEIQLDLTMHGAADPMCCPSVEATRRFRYADGELVEIEPPVDVPD